MDEAAQLVGIYGAVLATVLGVLQWRRDRHRLLFSPKFVRGTTGDRLIVAIVNSGHRPIMLAEAYFECADSGGYFPGLDSEFGFPAKLEEGDSMILEFDAEELDPDVVAFVVRGYDREHRHKFDSSFREQWTNQPQQ